jgi:hypothetical protein
VFVPKRRAVLKTHLLTHYRADERRGLSATLLTRCRCICTEQLDTTAFRFDSVAIHNPQDVNKLAVGAENRCRRRTCGVTSLLEYRRLGTYRARDSSFQIRIKWFHVRLNASGEQQKHSE